MIEKKSGDSVSERDPWFDELYSQYMHLLLKAAIHKLGNRAVAEEIVHDVFILLLLSREKVETYIHPEAWMFQVLNNKVKNELRRAKYRYEVPFDPEQHLSGDTVEPMKLEFSLPPGLNEQERQFLIWYYEEDLDHEEIARRLGCSVHACHARLSRAKKKCKKILLTEQIFSHAK